VLLLVQVLPVGDLTKHPTDSFFGYPERNIKGVEKEFIFLGEC
jgi:hypothetical protein